MSKLEEIRARDDLKLEFVPYEHMIQESKDRHDLLGMVDALLAESALIYREWFRRGEKDQPSAPLVAAEVERVREMEEALAARVLRGDGVSTVPQARCRQGGPDD